MGRARQGRSHGPAAGAAAAHRSTERNPDCAGPPGSRAAGTATAAAQHQCSRALPSTTEPVQQSLPPNSHCFRGVGLCCAACLSLKSFRLNFPPCLCSETVAERLASALYGIAAGSMQTAVQDMLHVQRTPFLRAHFMHLELQQVLEFVKCDMPFDGTACVQSSKCHNSRSGLQVQRATPV